MGCRPDLSKDKAFFLYCGTIVGIVFLGRADLRPGLRVAVHRLFHLKALIIAVAYCGLSWIILRRLIKEVRGTNADQQH
jgi:hypothetical protein